MNPTPLISYRREGRKLRATGTVVEVHLGHTKVKPIREDWGHVWVSQAEIEAGSEKGPPIVRKATPEPSERKKRERVPKPPPVPKWRQLVDRTRKDYMGGMQMFHAAIVLELADELEKAQTMFSKP